jgi:uncharacterized protein (TIGR00730 family)
MASGEPLVRVCVFCGSSAGANPRHRAAAARLGALLVERGLALVYGGGSVGLMGVIADAVLAAGGTAIGVIPRPLARKELLHTGLTELHVVPSMHVRKALMADLSDAFIALPGGYGTFEELLEIVTWAQLGIHGKPVGLLDVAGYYEGLARLFDRAVVEGFVRREHRDIVIVADEPGALLDRLATARPPPATRRWLDPSET